MAAAMAPLVDETDRAMLGCWFRVQFRAEPCGGLVNMELCRAYLLIEAVDVPFHTHPPDEPPPPRRAAGHAGAGRGPGASPEAAQDEAVVEGASSPEPTPDDALDLADRACDSWSVVANARRRFPRALRRVFIGSFLTSMKLFHGRHF